MPEVRLGIAGLGTVAQGVLEILRTNGDAIAARTGIDFSVVRVASRTPKDVDLLGAAFSTDLGDLVADEDVDIVVELIGGETVAKDLIQAALAKGKPVATANKAVIALHGNELLGANTDVPLRFEAAVAGAIPIIQAIQSGLVANRFERILGIINGTSNYILTAMTEQGAAFADALATAQELGYAEADPTFDVEGIDAAHKLTILLALGFDMPFDFDALHVEGITSVTAEDIQYAAELGYRIKHLGILRDEAAGLEARVHPTLVPRDNLLANVNGVLNAVLVRSDAAGDTMFSGPGAGGSATASAVWSDIVELARNLTRAAEPATEKSQRREIVPIDAISSVYYLRIPTRDEPGVFAEVTKALSSHNISIEAVIQKEPAAGQDAVDIVILTDETRESELNEAMREMQGLAQITGKISRIRVETL